MKKTIGCLRKSLCFVLILSLLPVFAVDTVVNAAGSEYKYVKSVLWDLDFTDETVDSSKSPTVTICNADGQPLRNKKGDVFRCHIGSEANAIKIEDGVMKLAPANTTDQVQTNEFYTTVSEGEAVYKLKVKVDDYNTTKNVFRLVYLGTDGNSYWAPQLQIKQATGIIVNMGWADTTFKVVDGTDSSKLSSTSTLTCKKGNWYDIEARFNFELNTYEYKVNSTVLASGTLGKQIASSTRVSLSCVVGEKNASPSVLYIDDIYFYEATKEAPLVFNVFIDGNKAERITEGRLTAGMTVLPEYDGTDCIFALYDGDNLKDVRIEKDPVKSAGHQVEVGPFDFGLVDESATLKLIILKNGTLEPVTKCIKIDGIMISTEAVDTDTLASIFESEAVLENYLNGKIGYHPDSGLVTINGSKIRTPYTGENKDGIVYVPAYVFAEMGFDVYGDVSSVKVEDVTFTAGSANASGISLDGIPFQKDDMLYVPLKNVVDSVLGKKMYTTDSGINAGAIIIGDSVSPPDSAIIQKLNYYLLYERPSKEKVLSDYNASPLKGVHPRVMMTMEDFERIKNAEDYKTISYRGNIIAAADALLDKEELIYELRDNVRLWYVSMDFMDRVMALAFAYRLTGNRAYLEKCCAEMDSIASFHSWHPEHHIDVGGLAVGFGIGYDWLYNELTIAQRARYEAALYKLCYEEYYMGFTDKSDDMKGGILAENNHNSVMNSGITICAIAFMDVFPDEGAYFISNSLRATEATVPNFAPDGAWYEGIGYGLMTLEYLSLQLATLETAFDTCYGIDAIDGMDMAARFAVNMQCSTGAFGYYDGGSMGVQWHSGALWFAEHFGDKITINEWYNHYNVSEGKRAMASFLMFYNPDSIYPSHNGETRWDIDFENVNSGSHSYGGQYVAFYDKNGRQLSSGGDTLTAHTGTSANSIEVRHTGNNTYKRALNMRAADSGEVQLNEFHTTLSADAIVFEYDYMIESLPSNTSGATITAIQPVLATGGWLSAIEVIPYSGGAYLKFGSKNLAVKKGEWHNLRYVADMKRRRAEVYIDGSIFGTVSIAAGYTKGQKLTARLKNAAGASVWIDNMKVSAVNHTNPDANADRDVFYEKNAVIVSRDSWESDEPTFFGAKGGYAAEPHGHMDMGTFTFFANGIRWLTDYGAEDYNLPQFWGGGTVDGMRWQYFAMRAEAHNCLIINPDKNGEYDPQAKAKFVRYETNDSGVIAVLDMTDVHNGKAEKARRGYFLTDDRKSLVVRDEVKLSKSSDVYFFLQTDHDVTIDGNVVTITPKSNSSKYVTIEFDSSASFELTKGDPVPLPTSPAPDGLMSTAGRTRIMLKTNVSGDLNITAKFTPHNVSGSELADYIKNIDNWSLNS